MKFDYYFINNVYSLDEIKEINDCAEKINSTLDDCPAKSAIKTSTVKVIPIIEFNNLLNKFLWQTNEINRHNYAFNLFETSMYENLNYNVYTDNGDEYGWHRDMYINQNIDIKLTAILNLSLTEYEGGNLEIYNSDIIEIKEFRKPGSLVVFPSFIPHRVTPVTSGKRISLSRWVLGPSWQ